MLIPSDCLQLQVAIPRVVRESSLLDYESSLYKKFQS